MSVLDFVPLSGFDHAVSIAGSATSPHPGRCSVAARQVNASSLTEPGVELVAERRGRSADGVDAPMAERWPRRRSVARSSAAAARPVVRALAQPSHLPHRDTGATSSSW